MSLSRRSGVSRVLAVAVVAWLLLGAVAGASVAGAASDGAAHALGDDGLVNETSSTVDETTDSTTETVDDTTDSTTETVDDTTDSTTETVDDTTDSTTDSVDSTTETVDDTTDSTTETTERVGNTTDLDGTTEAVTNATGETVDSTTDTVDETTDDTTATLLDTTTSVTTALSDGTTDAVSGLTTSTEDGLDAVAATSPVTDFSSGSSADTTTRERAARDGTVTDGTADGTTESVDDGDGATAGSGDDAAATMGGSGGFLTALPGELPVSEDAATGGLLGGLLVGAVGLVVRQASAAGGTGAGTAMLRTAAAGSNPLSRLARMLSVFRYSRYDDSDPLALEARRDVYEAISDQPGAPITAVSDRADVNLSTARHHVKVLLDEGLVATARVRSCERFYPAGTDDLELAAAMADEATADILDALTRLEPASVSGLAEEVDRSPSTVTHHLQKLEDDDIVVRERNGRAVENKLSEPARAALDPETERRQHAAERRLDAEAEATSGARAD